MKSLNEYLAYYDPMRESNERYFPEVFAQRSGTPGWLLLQIEN